MNDDDLMIDDDEQEGRISRWLPTVVVVGAMVGFLTLAWYAYHTGSHPTSESDLIVVEADKTPIKEKPADPGGMQFPNQDKTVFETFSGKAQPPAKVERVLPTPEEPMPTKDDNEPTTWVNEKLVDKNPAAKSAPEQVIGKKEASPAEDVAKSEPVRQMLTDKPMQADEPKTYVAAEPAAKVKEEAPKEPAKDVAKPQDDAAKAAPKEVAKPAAEDVKKVETPAPSVKIPTGKVQVQLGAYRSEEEAKEAWGKARKKIADLADMQPAIVRADLGEKGIYYRLRTGGFADAATAKSFCVGLTSQGQACLPASK